jgi:hypothetical protein
MSAFNVFMLAASIATLAGLYFQFVDHWSHVKKIAGWFRRRALRLKPDPTPVTLDIPPGPPPTDIPATTADGVTKICVMHVMHGGNQLLAYEVTRRGFPGARFLVERRIPNQQPKYCDTPNRDEANAQWRKWYLEWKAMPGGFGGASGRGLFGDLPW